MTIMLTMPNINSGTNEDKTKIKKMPKTAAALINMLVCPDTKSLLILDKNAQELISIQGKKAYPIEQFCPLLSEEYCRDLSINEVNKWQSAHHRSKSSKIE